jgi:integrase
MKTRRTASGGKRYRVEYRLGGRESRKRYGGSFATKREAIARRSWIAGELAAMRVPDLSVLNVEQPTTPTFAVAADAWRESRVDVDDGTRTLHEVALNRAMPILGQQRIDEITPHDVVDMVTTLASDGRKRETIRKTLTYVRAVLDDESIEPNPARDKRVRLPYEEQNELVPPSAEHVESVYLLLPSMHRLPLLWLDWSGARVGSIDKVLVSDYDEPNRRVRLRRSTTKTRQPLWVDLHPVLADALEATLPPREDRDLDARLFAESGSDALRTAIAKACKAAAIPLWSPHDLRHRRISLLHHQGRSWAEIGRFVGQRKLSITADTYTHVLIDATEIDYANLLAL